MILSYVGILSAISAIFAITILIYVTTREGFSEIIKYVLVGLIVASFDFFVEYLGTSTMDWVYHKSSYFILGLVPIELPILFFSGGIIGRFIYRLSSRIEKPVRLNTMLYLIILIGFLAYTRDLYYLKIPSNILYVAVPVGFWGILNIRKEGDRVSALILAAFMAIADALVETFIIRAGDYSYSTGFAWSTPLIYSLLTIGFFGFMEKIDKLDAFLEHPFIKTLLNLFGVYRGIYTKKTRRAISKVKAKTNGVLRKNSE